MINNYIIGKRSNLSKNLKKILPNSISISLKEKKDVEKLFNEKKKYNIIFNNFYPVSKLNEISIHIIKEYIDKNDYNNNYNIYFIIMIIIKKFI